MLPAQNYYFYRFVPVPGTIVLPALFKCGGPAAFNHAHRRGFVQQKAYLVPGTGEGRSRPPGAIVNPLV
jgi:hypothetical protein